MATAPPPPEALSRIIGPTTERFSRVDIYESDGTTRWMDANNEVVPRLITGTVSVDYDRDERRTLDIELDNGDDGLVHSPDGFWYDKILKVYSGVRYEAQPSYKEMVLQDKPTLYWRLGANADTENDISFNNYDGTAFTDGSSVVRRVAGPIVADDDNGALKIAIKSGMYSADPLVGVLAAEPIGLTMEIWVKPGTITSNMYIFTHSATPYIKMEGGKFVGRLTPTQTVIGATSAILNEWYHVVMTWTGQKLRLYVNGVLDGETLNTVTPPPANNQAVCVGFLSVTSNSQPFVGEVDEAAFYRYRLTAGQVMMHYFTGAQIQTVNKEWETQIGEFVIDQIDETYFPKTLKVTARDYTKRCLLSLFAAPVQFAKTAVPEVVIKNLLDQSHCFKSNLPVSGLTLGTATLYDRGTSRWEAIKAIATAAGWEIFFSPTGYCVARPFQDPVKSSTVYTFGVGSNGGNLTDFTRTTTDSVLFNHIVVSGESSDDAVPSVWAEVSDTDSESPTNVDRIGDRVFEYSSALITTHAQALKLANSYLSINALEDYSISFSSIPFIWLEAGDIIKWLAPTTESNPPTKFLLSSFDIPLDLGTMTGSIKRVIEVPDAQ